MKNSQALRCPVYTFVYLHTRMYACVSDAECVFTYLFAYWRGFVNVRPAAQGSVIPSAKGNCRKVQIEKKNNLNENATQKSA